VQLRTSVRQTQERTPHKPERIPTPLGEAFRLSKQLPTGAPTGAVYDLRVAAGADDAAADNCGCPAFLRRRRCRHVAALRLLIAEGEL
jgi:SWIM zinc finger